jgi:uncharacterized protein YdeI (YjbR/CyaY-like superfamily)
LTRTENFEQVEVSSTRELRRWLAHHHTRPDSVWLVTFKKHTGARYVSRDEVLDELICFGWIDGIRRKLDADRTMQLISPRKVQHWAKSYKDRAARLIEEGRMEAPGLESIRRSRESGLWDFLGDVDALIVPPDLAEALDARPDARRHFDAFPPANRRVVLRWIKLARKPETRSRRIARIAELASRNERLPGS